ncbi:MAG: hypothetical protein ACI3YC_02530 [Alloprevotella sp.]
MFIVTANTNGCKENNDKSADRNEKSLGKNEIPGQKQYAQSGANDGFSSVLGVCGTYCALFNAQKEKVSNFDAVKAFFAMAQTRLAFTANASCFHRKRDSLSPQANSTYQL